MIPIISRVAAWGLTLLLAFASVFVAAPAMAQQPAIAPAVLPKVLKVGTEGVYPPFSYRDGSKLTGFDVDVMNAIGRKLGVRIEFVETPWDSMFEALRSKRIDLVANQVTRNPERAALYDLSTPYVETTGVVVVKDDNTTIKGLSDLRGKRAAQNLTSNWKDVAQKAGATIVGVDSMDKALQNLRQGSVDVVVNDKLAVNSALKTLGDSAGVKVVAETSDRSESVLAARKGSGYMTQINSAISELKSDGTLNDLYDTYFSAQAKPKTDWDLVKENAWPMAWAAIKVTIPLTLIAFGLGLVLALGIAIARMSSNPIASGASRLYISLLRGVPVLVLLMIVYFGPSQFGVTMNPFVAAVIGLTLNASAYLAEVIRSAVGSVPGGQWEAARTVGMDYRTSLRRIVIPQAVRIAIPPMSNTLIGVLKDTSLVSAIAVTELFRQAQFAAAPTFKFFTLYLLAALYYWIIVVLMGAAQSRIEKRVSRFVA
ncbi:ABC transporter substrate-binding protein/permease [Dermacoccaceae bacterium W4C1]